MGMFALKALRSKLRAGIGVAEACVHHLREELHEDANGIGARLSARPIAIFGNAVHNDIERRLQKALVGPARPPARVRPERLTGGEPVVAATREGPFPGSLVALRLRRAACIRRGRQEPRQGGERC